MRLRKYFVGEPEAVKTYGEREVCQGNTAGKREYKARTTEMWLRQEGLCAICGKWVDQNAAESDHQDGRGYNGGHRDDRIVDENGNWRNAAVCHICNSEKASKRYHWVGKSYLPVMTGRELQEKVTANMSGIEFCLSEEFLPEL